MVILPGEDIEALGLHDGVSLLDGVINSHLVRAFTHLSLTIEHEASTKRVDFVVKGA